MKRKLMFEFVSDTRNMKYEVTITTEGNTQEECAKRIPSFFNDIQKWLLPSAIKDAIIQDDNVKGHGKK